MRFLFLKRVKITNTGTTVVSAFRHQPSILSRAQPGGAKGAEALSQVKVEKKIKTFNF